jgi:hypothetical protein
MPLPRQRVLHPRSFVAVLIVLTVGAGLWWAVIGPGPAPSAVLLLVVGAAAGFANSGST